MFGKMLVPLDGSEQAAGILPYVARLAAGSDALVVLLTVIDSGELAQPDRFGGSDARPGDGDEGRERPILTELEDAACRMLEIVAAELSNHGVNSEYRVVRGAPAVEIVRAAGELECDLIAMSTHGRNMFSRAILGSVTDKVVHSSPVPVLTTTMAMKGAGHLEEVDISEVLVPLDGSALAEMAVPFAEALARDLSLVVNLVTVVDTGGPYHGLLDDARSVHVDPEIRARSREYLDRVSRELTARGLNVRTTIKNGRPGPVLSELVGDPRQRIVVMATHGLSGLTRWWLGSVTETVIRTSRDPVLVISQSNRSDA